MKLLIILSLVAFACAAEWRLLTYQEWDDVETKCAQRLSMPEKRPDNDEVANKMFVEMLMCAFRGAGVWTDSEGFMVDRWMIAVDNAADKAGIDRKFVRDGLEKCADKNIQKSSTEDWAYRSFMCLKSNEDLLKALKKARLFDEKTVPQE